MTKQQLDFLLALAALSLSFVGFSTIVVVLRQALGAQLSRFHLLLVRLFIETGLAVTAFSILPPMLEILGLDTSSVWRLSSAIAGPGMLVYFISYARRRRRDRPGPFPLRMYVNGGVSVAAAVGLVLNAGGWLFVPGAPAYIVALTWVLIQSGLVFVQTLDVFLGASSEG